MKRRGRPFETLGPALRKVIHTPEELAEMERRFEESRARRRAQSQPELDAIRESERLTAADFLVTINCRDH